MLILKAEKKEKKLVLGDYVTIHTLGDKVNQGRIGFVAPRDVLVKHGQFFQRMLKDRRELNGVQHRKAA